MKKVFSKITALLILVSVLIGILASCTEDAHTHAYDTKKSDATSHWDECSCGEKANTEYHLGGEATCTEKAKCSSCGAEYGETIAHSYTTLDSATEEGHVYKCECGEALPLAVHTGGKATCTKKAKCSSCGAEYGETLAHRFVILKSKDSTTHTYRCSCGKADEPEAHEFTISKFYNAYFHEVACECGELLTGDHTLVDGICFCGYKTPEAEHVHNFNTLKYDAENHWYECECKEISAEASHSGGEATCTEYAKCEFCEASYGELLAHEYDGVIITEASHTYFCDCGDTEESEAHTVTGGACECGYSLPSEPHTHSFEILKYNGAAHWYECACQVADESEAHKGGEADCETKAVCSVCSQAYGQLGHEWNCGELTVAPHGETLGVITYTCEDCGEKKTETVDNDAVLVTREDIEKALVAVGWAYYMKGTKLQYDSSALNAISAPDNQGYGNHYGGTGRHTNEVAPEYGTSDTTIYSVCTGFTHKTYLQAINRLIFEQSYSPNGIVTMLLWVAGDNQPEETFKKDQDEYDPLTDDRDCAILRWVDYETYKVNEPDELNAADKLGVFASSSFGDWYTDGTLELRADGNGGYSYYLDGTKITSEKAKELVKEYITKKVDGEYVNLRPGDIFTEDTHALLYIGNGYVLDCNGSKYDIGSGTDKVEANGAVYGRMLTIEKVLSNAASDFIINRPLDYYIYDCDGNAANDLITYKGEAIEVNESAKSRIEFPAMEIDRTVDITPFGTVEKDGTLTYTVKISNRTTDSLFGTWMYYFDSAYMGEDYEGLVVTEKIPEGTVLVSATEGYELVDGTLRWTFDIKAGRSAEIYYTVKVTAEVGDTIVNDGGFVANIPSNSISNRVGEKKLTEEQKNLLADLVAEADKTDWSDTYGTDLEFAEKIYEALGVTVSLPTVEEIIENLFAPYRMETVKAFSLVYSDINSPMVMYRPVGEVSAEYQTLYNMIVDRYIGGYRLLTTDVEKFIEVGAENFDYATEINYTIMECRKDYLEVGDVLVFATAKNRGNEDLTCELESTRIAIYAGNGNIIEMSSDGCVTVYSGEATDAYLVSTFKSTNDIFFLLRPSQVMDVSGEN